MIILAFLAGVFVGSGVTLFCATRQQKQQRYSLTVDVDMEKIAAIFKTADEQKMSSFYLDFPGVKEGDFLRLIFISTKTRLENIINE